MHEVLVENVKWDAERVIGTGLRVIEFFGYGLQDLGTKGWMEQALNNLVPVVKGEKAARVVFKGNGFRLIFYGPNLTFDVKKEDGQEIWHNLEPSFALVDRSFGRLPPSWRNYLYSETLALGEEAEKVYHLSLYHNPFTLVFPKHEYAEDSYLQRGVIL